MERNREARRATMAASVNGLSRRRHRSSSLRDSPEEDGPVEMHEPGRLRDRGVKKDRDRDRDRDRERDRSSRSKRRRGDRLIHGSNRDDVGEESSEESVNDEEDEDDDEGGGGGSAVNGGAAVRMLPPNPAAVASISSSLTNHHQQQQHRKSFLPSVAAKVFRPVGSGWKPTDEMIGFSVPRKARSASTKRSHEIWMSGGGGSGGGGVEQIHRQASTSPVRPTPTPSPAAAAPISPSSSNVSVRKKIKSNGPKLRPPKSSSKSSSSNPEELEIEIAEVLYGLKTHSQGPSKKENDSNNNNNNNNNNNKSSSDAKSRVSSPISNSTSTAPQSSVFPQNSNSSATPLSAVAPKRKRPRQVSDNLGSFIRNSPISSTSTATMKVEIDQPTKTEISGQNPEKNSGSVAENGGVSHDFASSVQPETPLPESGTGESKPVIEESRESRDLAKEEVVVTTSPKKESSAVRPDDDDHEDSKGTKVNLTNPEIESRRDEKFQIDLMVTPPQLRSSPEREAGEMNFVAATEQKPVVSEAHAQMRTTRNKDKEEEKGVKSESGGGDEAVNVVVEPELKKAKATDADTDKPVVVVNSSNSSKERNNIDLHLDLEKSETVSSNNKLHSQTHKQPKASRDEQPPHTEKTTQSSSLPLPMSMASWPGGLPSMGYMAPLQGVVSMDGSPVVPSTPIPPLFSQPRPKRCATHCYIARNIYLQQFMKMNPFWSAAAGSASLFGTKPCNLNVVPSTELHGNIAGRSVNTVVQEKGQGLSIFPGHSGKDKASQAANLADAHRKQQLLIQQALAPGASPNNILHGPAFIFPLNQQQAAAAAAASVRPGTAKSPTTGGSVGSTSASNSTSMNGSATAAPTAAALGFNYPNVPGNETPYLAILQGNAYPFQIPAVGAPPTYRGTHAQAMPYFNGSFYSSQMIHPSQLQQQQQQPSTQQQQVQQGHQNTSISSGSSSSQKHLQSQQQRQQGSSTNGGNGNGNVNLQSFSASKNRSSQQQQPNQHLSASYQNRQLESEVGGEDSPSNADSRVSRAPMSLYGPNFAMPFQHQNFALMTPPPPLAGANGGGGNQGEKKQQQQPQQQGSKPGVESLPPQTFAMSFASMPPGIDISSMAQNHAVLQSLPEANRQNFQIMAAAAQAAQPKKNFRVSEEGKTGGGDSSTVDEEKKGSAGKIPVSVGQSIVFSRPDLTDASASTIPGSTVIDSSARTLNLVSAPSRSSRSSMPNAIGTVNSPTNSQMQAQLQYQQQHILQLQKHHQQQQQQHMQQQLAPTAAARNKTPATSNGSVYSDHLNTSSSAAAAKFSTVLSSAFPQNLGQSSSSSPAQSPQWKNSARTTSQIPSSLASSTTSSLKNLPQQQARTQQSHTQISFGASQKSTPPPQGQQAPNSHQSQSPPMMVGSPSTSSISKGAGGSPRMSTSTSQGNKAAQPSTLSSQQSKNSASVPSRKSSPVGSRNVPSILGNPHITSSSTGTKSQMQQQQLPKHTVQQPQLFFTSAYMQAQGPHSTGASYIQRRRPEQQQQSQQQQQQNSFAATSSTGMLSLCTPVTLASTSTSDAKAVAAAASTMKGGSGGLTPQSIPHPVQFAGQSSGNSHHLVPPGFSIVHAVPGAVVKPAEQKQPAGNRGCLTRK